MRVNHSRRKFILRATAALGAATLACGGLSAVALRAPVKPSDESTFPGESTMNQKVLVAYASRAGSTMEVAETVAKEIASRGYAVDVRPVKQVTSLEGYGVVVIGSAVRMGQWLPEATQFIEKNQAALKQLPAAFFAVHLMNLGDDETSRKARLAYLDAARKLVTPRSEAFFAGVGDMSKVSFLDRMIGKLVKSPEGDFRDWPAIRAWAQQIAL